ncbi:MAG: hypothetical protein HC845_08960 [Akkermansiaceae bacterium]|nr:hypothetical protein [Akkermansiaceae bacterium]
MANPHDHPTALKDLQDSIYREKVLRARGMTTDERWETGFELTNAVSERMISGAMWKLQTNNRSMGFLEARKGLDRLCKARDHKVYVTELPHSL